MATNILTTRRTIVRAIQKSDFQLVRQLDQEAEGLIYVNGGHEKTLEESKGSFQRMLALYNTKKMGFHTWNEISTGNFIGWGGFKYIEDTELVEIGYRIRMSYWGKGYTSEVAEELIRYGRKQLGLKTIYGRAHPENTPSIRILEKIGMKYVESSFFKNIPVSVFRLG